MSFTCSTLNTETLRFAAYTRATLKTEDYSFAAHTCATQGIDTLTRERRNALKRHATGRLLYAHCYRTTKESDIHCSGTFCMVKNHLIATNCSHTLQLVHSIFLIVTYFLVTINP